MLKPVVIFMEKAVRQDVPTYLADHFIENGFYPIWSSFEIPQASRLKEKAEVFLVILPRTMDDAARQICFYMRDIGIDEEKTVFLCGAEDALSQAKKMVPAMVLKGAYAVASGEMEYVAHQMKRALLPELEKKSCLIIDDDTEYTRNLRMAFREHCNVAVSDGSIAENAPFLKDAYLLLLSVDLKLDILAWSALHALLKRREKENRLHVVFLAKTKERQAQVNRYISENGVCLSKDTDFLKNANHIVKRYFSSDASEDVKNHGTVMGTT